MEFDADIHDFSHKKEQCRSVCRVAGRVAGWVSGWVASWVAGWVASFWPVGWPVGLESDNNAHYGLPTGYPFRLSVAI